MIAARAQEMPLTECYVNNESSDVAYIVHIYTGYKMLSWKYHRRGPVVLNNTDSARGGTGAVSVDVWMCVSVCMCVFPPPGWLINILAGCLMLAGAS